MANMEDYLDWRGDITFDVDPFNEVDNLILSELVYTDFGGIVPKEFDKSITISDAHKMFFDKYTEEEIMKQVSSVKVAPFIMHRLIESKRFKDVKLYGYVNEISNEDQIQFSVMTCELPDNTIYVAYRGTDNSLIGWKEDFNMSFVYETPGQKQAALYLNQNFQNENRPIRVGGHSKGGNFAVFASAFCNPKIQDKIIEVYSNDGPGFRKEVLEAEGYKKILPKVVSTLPEQSVVGVLLGNQYNHHFVKSSNSGLMQHDAMSWQVKRNTFEFVDNQGNNSAIMEDSLKMWLSDLDDEKRKRFVDLLFDSLMASGANTTDEYVKNGIKSLSEGMKTLKDATAEDKKLFIEVFKKLGSSIGASTKEKIQEQWSSNVKGFVNGIKESKAEKIAELKGE
ncbi:MAG: DUF2974 domain-containing protein [Lachnospiraceae bacterium]|nr:DUF2974 domain-containing protein [Lachnospiraceae bacterium]